MSETKTKKEIGRECRFAIHLPTKSSERPDLHLVKEQIHFDDGSMEPHLRWIREYKRAYYITKPSKRDHKQKKEYEKIDYLLKKEVTQSDLRMSIARSLDMHWSKDPIKKLLQSPYIYGADISSTSLIKKDYMLKWPTLTSKYTRCIFDTETDVIEGHEEIIMATVVFNTEVFISVTQKFLEGHINIEERLQAAARKYIGPHLDQYKMVITLHIATDVVDLCKTIFAKVHKWKPDWLAIWNIKFDIPKVIDMLEKYNVDPRDVLCDPSIPKELRVCEFKPGPDKQVTASGKVKPINPAAQWHTLRCTSSYYAIDAMCVYKHLRLGEQEESSYGLDAILTKILKLGKLTFKEADGLEKLEWHRFMQKNYKIEYMVYNIFDCVSMIMLDDKLQDLGYTLPAFAVTTDFANFKSNPRKIMDQLHYFVLERGYVMGTVGYAERTEAVSDVAEEINEFDEEEDEEDDCADENTAAEMELLEEEGDTEVEDMQSKPQRTTLSLKDWIVTLPAHMSVLGLKLIAEDGTLCTGIRTHVYDADETAAYPSATMVGNVSKGTTKREIIDIIGIRERVFRRQNMNLLIGSVNALEYSTTMFKLPKPEDLLLQFQRDNL